MSKAKFNVWTCKIVTLDVDLPNGFDSPPRSAAMKAIESAGIEIIGCSSGWGGHLSKDELKALKEKVGEVYFAGISEPSNTKLNNH